MENQQPSQIELPQPVSSNEHPKQSSEAPKAQPEVAPSSEGASNNVAKNPPLATPPSPLLPTEPTGISPQVKTTTLTDDNPSIADDVDVIEKEWVHKAREIVAKTKDDPHQQNKALSTFKADYMKKRYGKDLKLAGD